MRKSAKIEQLHWSATKKWPCEWLFIKGTLILDLNVHIPYILAIFPLRSTLLKNLDTFGGLQPISNWKIILYPWLLNLSNSGTGWKSINSLQLSVRRKTFGWWCHGHNISVLICKQPMLNTNDTNITKFSNSGLGRNNFNFLTSIVLSWR